MLVAPLASLISLSCVQCGPVRLRPVQYDTVRIYYNSTLRLRSLTLDSAPARGASPLGKLSTLRGNIIMKTAIAPNDAVVVAYRRTPIGRARKGSLAGKRPEDLAAGSHPRSALGRSTG